MTDYGSRNVPEFYRVNVKMYDDSVHLTFDFQIDK